MYKVEIHVQEKGSKEKKETFVSEILIPLPIMMR